MADTINRILQDTYARTLVGIIKFQRMWRLKHYLTKLTVGVILKRQITGKPLGISIYDLKPCYNYGYKIGTLTDVLTYERFIA